MARKIIIDCDLGTDDAVALCLLLLDPELDVLAVTAVEGCVPADQANNNLQAIVSELDPARHPRLGNASPADDAPAVDTRFLHGDDGLGNADLEASRLQHASTSEKLIIDFVRAYPDEVSILCLGPLTNLARALRREPALAANIGQVIMVGGTLTAEGNITACADFNFYFDPVSAREVLCSRMTKTLIPLDVTRQVTLGLNFMDELPCDNTRVGSLLRRILPYVYRSFRRQLGLEAITVNDAVGALAALDSDLFEFEQFQADVETEGELTRGMLVLDRRPRLNDRPNVSIATSIRAEAAAQMIADQLTMAGKRTKN